MMMIVRTAYFKLINLPYTTNNVENAHKLMSRTSVKQPVDCIYSWELYAEKLLKRLDEVNKKIEMNQSIVKGYKQK